MVDLTIKDSICTNRKQLAGNVNDAVERSHHFFMREDFKIELPSLIVQLMKHYRNKNQKITMKRSPSGTYLMISVPWEGDRKQATDIFYNLDRKCLQWSSTSFKAIQNQILAKMSNDEAIQSYYE